MSQTERIFFIDRTIREYGGVSIPQVCAEFEVCSRQAKRDIEYMRDRLDAPIVWSWSNRRYEYSQAWKALQCADERSVFAISFLRSILLRFHYIPVFSYELLQMVQGRFVGCYASIAEKVVYELSDMEILDDGVALILCQALLKYSPVAILYRDGKGQVSQRVIRPTRLINYSGKWYCVALDSLTDVLRTFAVSRIQCDNTINPSDLVKSTFLKKTIDEKEVEYYVSASYGIFKGKSIGTATLRFYGGAARAVREQVWHKNQTMEDVELSDGRKALDLTLPVHDWTELLGRALRCGSNCEVLTPQEFRRQWIDEIKKMQALTEYCSFG